jgi:hypothetical protein
MRILGEEVHGERLLEPIRATLEAGFMEGWKLGRTYSGTPRGGVASPPPSNVYLDQLDQSVERELPLRYGRGKYREVNPEWSPVNHAINDDRERLSGEEYQRLVRLRRTPPSRVSDDPVFRRLRYVRYADDFLPGFVGPKSEAEQIKVETRDFLSYRSKLNVPRDIVQARLQRLIRAGKPACFTPLIAQSDYHLQELDRQLAALSAGGRAGRARAYVREQLKRIKLATAEAL